ncbi:serine/threonine-protein kinase [Tahibacter amnicola]|uniref:Protein kinase n=1 Tax=Tahibacter amnicola TaxID=2976241 RepID=A0ABY6BCI5_9GAMM|nr:serine/threonine-protein kinase [Tahibacter amnicola]UXI67545.1 protein kinase [Tahibacter amnicola]
MNDAASGVQRPSAQAATITGVLAAYDVRIGEVLAGRFRIDALLGVGGMGMVYRARDLSLDIDVAVKLLRPELVRRGDAFERFRQELLLARQVSSPHVVRIHDITQHGDRWLITMDFIEGESLEDRLVRQGRLEPETALAIAQGLLEGLAAAHERQVVHRDLKPANILLDAAGKPFITDFGVARSLGTSGMTGSGLIMGTPGYLSPEQARGDTIDTRSDLYTTGLILYEMLCGQPPFCEGTPAESMVQRLVRPPPSLARQRPDLPAWVHRFVDRLLRLNPAHRFSSAREALAALQTRHVPRPRPSRRVLLSLLLAVVALGGAVFFVARLRVSSTVVAAPAVATPPQWAVVPFDAPADEDDLRATARFLDEHLRQWLRQDAAITVVPRARVKAAIARAAPGATGERLARRWDTVARAANADNLVYAELRRGGEGLLLSLEQRRADGSIAATLAITGTTPAALYTRYLATIPQLLPTIASQPPAAPAESVRDLGRLLQAVDAGPAAGASLPVVSGAAPGAAALDTFIRLQALERARDELGIQEQRRIALERGEDASLLGLQLRATALRGNGDAEAAIALIEPALARYANDTELALLAAEILAENGQAGRASSLLHRLTERDEHDARSWFLLGRTAIQAGDAQRAVDEYLVRALVLATRAGDSRAEADARNALGVGYERLGQLDAAADEYTRAARLRQQDQDLRGEATSLRNLAIVRAVQGDRAAAQESVDKAARLLEALGDRASLADLYNDRGVIAEERGDYTAALSDYRQALALRQALTLADAVAESFTNVGFCYFQLGQMDNAQVYWRQAQAQYEALGDRTGMLHVAQSLGMLEMAQGEFAAAGARLAASLRQAEDLQLPEETAVAHTYLGELALAEGRLGDALSAMARARDDFQRRDDQRGLAETALLSARVQLAYGDADAALQTLQALSTAERSPEQSALATLIQARAQQEKGAAEAGDTLTTAEKAATHHPSLAVQVRIERVRAALRQGDRSTTARTLNALLTDTTAMGQPPVRLAVLQLALAAAARGWPPPAQTSYREGLELLRKLGRWNDDTVFHASAMGAFQRAGATAEAARAQKSAQDALSRWLAGLPADQRATAEAALRRRITAEAGHDLSF